MCGICGQFNFKNNRPVNPEDVKKMTSTLVNRGPDDEGFYIAGELGFGFRRLSIIDLGGGHQPMSDIDETVWVMCNGEIYNFPELKAELEMYGHRFRTHSDTEVIIHGYKQWGIDILHHLNGMFGLAVWDTKKKLLMLARDCMGIKPLYYKVEHDGIKFGSEIRSLLACEKAPPEIDAIAVNLFLRYRYTPSPLTILKGIKKLAAGTCLIVKNGSVRTKRWWQFTPRPHDPMPTQHEAKKRLLGLYESAVKRQLISDVPVGLLLSGGLDSGLLLALMNQCGDNWKTFTVGFGEKFRDDELILASRTAKILNVENLSVKINQEIFNNSLRNTIYLLEEPVAASSIVPMYFVSKLASENVKVVLMGQGPDELFGGYYRHLGVRYGAYWRHLPGWCRKSLGAVLNKLPRNETVKRALYSLDTPGRIQRYQQIFSLLNRESIDTLFHDGVLPDTAGDKILECWQDMIPLMKHTDELGGLQFLEMRSSLPDELLLYADKLSMAHGLEIRVPYLDQDVVKYAEQLSATFKVHNGQRKWLHRIVCRDFLPPAILNRKKRGFQTPIDQWFRESINNLAADTLGDNHSLMYNFLRPEAVHKLLKDHQDGRSNNFKILFSIVVLEECLRNYLT